MLGGGRLNKIGLNASFSKLIRVLIKILLI